MLVLQRRRQRKLQNLSATQRELRRRFIFVGLGESFGPRYDIILVPNDQVRPALCYAAFLCVPHKIVESIQRAFQLSIRKYPGQARYRQCKQQHEYEYREDNLDQRKAPQPLHRRTYLIDAESQHVGSRLINDGNPNNDCGSRPSNRPALKRAAAFWFVPSVITRLRQGYVVAGPPRRQSLVYRPNIDAGAAASCSSTAAGPPNGILNPATTNTSTSGECGVAPTSGATVTKLHRVG